MPTGFKFYWALHNIALITSFAVTIIYWSILHNGLWLNLIDCELMKFRPNINDSGIISSHYLDKIPLDAANILSHAMNSVIMFMDILIVAYPLRLYHVIQPIAFGVSFGIFSYIYYVCGGVNLYDLMKVNHPDFTEIDDFCIFISDTATPSFTMYWIGENLKKHRLQYLVL